MTDVDLDLLFSYAGILSLATLSVYSGSYGSLKVSGDSFSFLEKAPNGFPLEGTSKTKGPKDE